MNTETNSELHDERAEGGNPPALRMFGTDLGGAPLPALGLLYSVLGHGLLAVALLYVPWSDWLPREAHLAMAPSTINAQELLLLPKLEPMASSGRATRSSNGGGARKEGDLASSYDSKAVRGVVYRGPQLLVSNPPHPDNFVQSIRQPDLAVRPKLPAPLPLPSMVSIAPAKPLLAPQPMIPREKPIQVLAVEPITLPAQERVEAPKAPLPVTSTADAPVRTVADLATPVSMPKLAHKDPLEIRSKAHNVLVVDAIPVLNSKPSKVPPGELYGSFTVSPSGAAVLALAAGGGMESKGAPGMSNASGGSTSPYAGEGSKSSGKTGESNAARTEAGTGTGAGQHGTTGADEIGTGSGPGVHVSRGGSGLGAGSGRSPFPSIMIQGGSGDRGGRIARGQAIRTSKPQTAYGITIVANGSSGGGFKDFGVFRDEASYTVYLDMEDEGLYGSGWALQYALDSHHAQDLSYTAPHAHGPLAPPYATSKSLPHFPPDAVKRGSGGAIVVFGFISQQGEFEDLRIMHSPDTRLDQLLLASLRKWKFRPAEMDGAQVAVKVLLGVPVNSVLRE